MASDETMTINTSSVQDFDYDVDQHHHHHPHNLSRLSMCSSSMRIPSSSTATIAYDGSSEGTAYYGNVNGGASIGDDDHDMGMYMSRLSIDGSDGDADEEFSDDDKKERKGVFLLSSDSDKEPGCLSLPATPPRRRRRGYLGDTQSLAVKDYASENETRRGLMGNKMIRRNSRRRASVFRDRWVEGCWEKKNSGGFGGEDEDEENIEQRNNFSGESECLVITKPKGGRRNLCMDLDEVKACRDLGFELEHERMVEIPSRISMSAGSPIDTSSGGNSPIASWRISSPGDDPKDVKARLKVWAHAVALASTSHRTLSPLPHAVSSA